MENKPTITLHVTYGVRKHHQSPYTYFLQVKKVFLPDDLFTKDVDEKGIKLFKQRVKKIFIHSGTCVPCDPNHTKLFVDVENGISQHFGGAATSEFYAIECVQAMLKEIKKQFTHVYRKRPERDENQYTIEYTLEGE